MRILENGSCEEFKGAVHAMALSLAAVMGLYNLAAWMQRREAHLAINAFVYIGAIAFESRHVNHHRLSALKCAALAAAAGAVRNVPPGDERLSSPSEEQQAA